MSKHVFVPTRKATLQVVDFPIKVISEMRSVRRVVHEKAIKIGPEDEKKHEFTTYVGTKTVYVEYDDPTPQWTQL